MTLTIKGLTKTYGNGVQALKNLNLSIGSNMFGLLGPNGAGKSTLMRTVATLQSADSGEIWLDSLNVLKERDSVRRILGYLPQEFGIYPKMTALDMLDHLAIMKGILQRAERKAIVEDLLQRVNLWDWRKKRLGGFSGGMKQRFGIAQALLGNPKLIIVDEPTAGLDPTERNRFLNLLSSIGSDVIVILSTHIVDDVSELCSQMAMISNGELILEGPPQTAINQLKNRMWRKTVSSNQQLAELESNFHVTSTHLVGGFTQARIVADTSPGSDFTAIDPDLEDVYFLNLSRHQRN